MRAYGYKGMCAHILCRVCLSVCVVGVREKSATAANNNIHLKSHLEQLRGKDEKVREVEGKKWVGF